MTGQNSASPSSEPREKSRGGRPANPSIRPSVLREKRTGQGLSRPALARKMRAAGCPVAQNTIASWEAGTWSPSTDRLVALCAVLGVEVRELLAAP